MQIAIVNEMESIQEVRVFPKPAYVKDNLYRYTDLGNGDYQDRNYRLSLNEAFTLFMTNDIQQEPCNIALEVFDSIWVVPFNEDREIMKFYPDQVTGYPKNLFEDSDAWSYALSQYDEPDNFHQNPVESHDYIFVISADRY